MDAVPPLTYDPAPFGAAASYGTVTLPAHAVAPARQPDRDSAMARGLVGNADARETLHMMLEQMVRAGGSDLHITVGLPPMARIHGDLDPLPGWEKLTPADTEAIVRSVVTDEQWQIFERDLEYDLAYSLPNVSRFRINLFQQRNSYGSVMRAIPHGIKQLHELGIPEQISRFASMSRGLVLVTGPTGSGKTTTLAALLDLANRTRQDHIVTIEDPIEFLHTHNKCVVNQRELGVDTFSFTEALKHVLRQDPDIILVGEMRDLETVSTALTAAETGHLVLATLHTQSAAQTVDRVIDMFPAHQQQEIRAQLSTALQGVVTQSLARRPDGSGRTVVCEVMFATSAIRNLIREGKNHQIPSFMQSSGGDGMLTFDAHLAQRVREGAVGYEQAMTMCHNAEDFRRLAGHGL